MAEVFFMVPLFDMIRKKYEIEVENSFSTIYNIHHFGYTKNIAERRKTMLKIYICPNCYNIRMVSKKTNAICLHCDQALKPCDISYDMYTKLDDKERQDYKDGFLKRLEF